MANYLFSLFAVCAVHCTANAAISVDAQTGVFKDQYNRTLMFHGVNVVYKIAPFYPTTAGFDPATSLVEKDADDLAAWGFNIVRLGVMWPGVMPTADGAINTTYIDVMVNLTKMLGKRGIQVLVDLHQDLLAPQFCGEGAPEWLVASQVNASLLSTFPEPVSGFTKYHQPPLASECASKGFGAYYLSDSVGKTFQALYDSFGAGQASSGFKTALTAYWSAVAKAFDPIDNVIGFELINEPWIGDVVGHPSWLLNPAAADKANLLPLYNTLGPVIRSFSKKLIFFEPVTGADVNLPWAHCGLGTPPFRGVGRTDAVLSYHDYCVLTNGAGDPDSRLCTSLDNGLVSQRIDDAKRMGVGAMMTEFGAMSGTPLGVTDINNQLKFVESQHQSWIYWQFKSYNDITTTGGGEGFYNKSGVLETGKVAALSRCYPQAVAGDVIAFQYDDSSAQHPCVLRFSAGANANTQPTVLATPSVTYPGGYNFTITPAGAARGLKVGSQLQILATAAAGTAITVVITGL